MWLERNAENPNYARISYVYRQHHLRFKRYVEANGLPCQACRGRGGETDVILDDGTGPWDECGWCEGEGLTTRWLRGMWLRYRRQEKREEQQRRQARGHARVQPTGSLATQAETERI
jgi:hypothetical protein